jgi:RES domain-containing protein
LRLYRIYNHHADYAKVKGFDPLDGAGGLTSASRWNLTGYPVLYTSSSAALALAEMLVHIPAVLFGERTLLELEVRGEVSTEVVTEKHLLQLLRDALPNNPLDTTQAYGNAWLREKRSLLLKVPSIPLPFEANYLVNTLHPDMKQIRLVSSEKIYLDRRVIAINSSEEKP